MEEQLIGIFCDVDDFCQEYEKYSTHHALTENAGDTALHSRMCLSEIITIVIFFHLSKYRNFKWYYLQYIQKNMRSYFPKQVSYNRFVELMGQISAPLLLYLMSRRLGKCSGISFVDSTTLKVCDNHRIHSNRVFSDIAKRGKSSMGWFFGFKLHLVINDCGEILSFRLTPGNIDDKDWKVMDNLTKTLFGKLFADKGYISNQLFQKLWQRNIQLITKVRKNMKNKLMDISDKLLLRKRAIIESVNDFLKNICQIEHSRHRSVINFLVNLLAGLAAYSFLPTRPSLHLDEVCSLQA